jgi:hypothetical protein
MRSRSLGLWLPALLCVGLTGGAPVPDASPLVRDQSTVTVQAVREEWRLVWTATPKAVCPAEEVVVSMTCPCSGWAYGEAGDLVLARIRDGREVDRLRLAPLFSGFDGPGDVGPGDAYVQRWPEKHGDMDRQERGDPKLLAEIHRRPTPSIINPADYNHDGQATEFLVQVGTLPCGKHVFAAVGVTAARPTLHALGSMIWNCDDHSSEVRSILTVSAEGGVIRAVDNDYSCASTSRVAGMLIKTTEW